MPFQVRAMSILRAAERAEDTITVVRLEENNVNNFDVEELFKAALDLSRLCDTMESLTGAATTVQSARVEAARVKAAATRTPTTPTISTRKLSKLTGLNLQIQSFLERMDLQPSPEQKDLKEGTELLRMLKSALSYVQTEEGGHEQNV